MLRNLCSLGQHKPAQEQIRAEFGIVRNAAKFVKHRPVQGRPRADLCTLLQKLCSTGMPKPVKSGIQVSRAEFTSAQATRTSSLTRSQVHPRRIENAPPEGVKSTLGGSKMEPRSRRGGPGAPKRAQGPPKSLPRGVQERSESAPRRPRTSKSGPRAAQERPKSAPRRPKSTPRAPRRIPRGLSRRPEEPSGTLLTLQSSKKVLSESDSSRDAFEQSF